MNRAEKYDRLYVGVITGLVIPLIVGFCVFLFSSGNKNLAEYFQKIAKADIITHIISLCVFPNLFLFLIFNRLDMLRATRGVLGVTIFWAVLVFAVKFLT
jgi:hypothetical protein